MSSSDRERRDGAPSLTFPAVDVLARDQQQLLTEGNTGRNPAINPIADGFDTYWECLTWLQAAAIRTLGHLPRTIPLREFQPTTTLARHLFADDAAARHMRQRCVEKLTETCRDATRHLVQQTEEVIETDDTDSTDTGVDDWTDVDVNREKSPAMRPGLRRLDRNQADALTELWRGFGSRSDLMEWVAGLSTATVAFQPTDLQAQLARSPAMLDWLIDNPSRTAQLSRYRFAVSHILPVFNKAARSFQPSEVHQKAGPENPWNEPRD